VRPENTKTHVPMLLPMTDQVRDVLKLVEELREHFDDGRSEWVFPGVVPEKLQEPGADLCVTEAAGKKFWLHARDLVQSARLSAHDLRHAFTEIARTELDLPRAMVDDLQNHITRNANDEGTGYIREERRQRRVRHLRPVSEDISAYLDAWTREAEKVLDERESAAA